MSNLGPTTRDDLDGLYDDETIVEDPEIRRARNLMLALIMALGAIFIATLIIFFRPEGQIVLKHWPNGYRKTQTNFISAPNKEGRLAHGPHRAWHANGALAERGRYERGQPAGVWQYWNERGELIPAPQSSESSPNANSQLEASPK